jgi:hypothetical protein
VAQRKKIKKPDEQPDAPEGPKKKHLRKPPRKKDEERKRKGGNVVASKRKKLKLVARRRKKFDVQPDASREPKKKQSAKLSRLRKPNVLSGVGLDGPRELTVKQRLQMLNRRWIVGDLKWTLPSTKIRNVVAGGKSDAPGTHLRPQKSVVESQLLLAPTAAGRVTQTMIINLPMAQFIPRTPSARRRAGLIVERTRGSKTIRMLLHLRKTHRPLKADLQTTLSPMKGKDET